MYKFFKRFFDIVFSFFLIIIFIPIFIIIGIVIKIDSKGPVFFKQKRLGKNGKEFNIIKFRSMVKDAENTGSGIFSYSNDSRITKVGNFLRNTSMDELPQVFNIFSGKMSFIGPRPCVTYELGDYETLNEKYKKRFQVKPGITGLAQVSGRNELDWETKVELDNKYIDLLRKRGLITDTKIFFMTIGKVFSKRSIVESKIDDSVDDEESAKLASQLIIEKAHEKTSDEYN